MAIGRVTWRALGTNVVVLSADPAATGLAAAITDKVLDAVDRAYSRFRPDSELSLITAGRAVGVRVSPLLALAVGEALRVARLTGGAVDPTVGQAIRRVGYDRDFSMVPATGGPLHLEVRRVPGWQAIELDRASRWLRLPEGCELDLGSTGKALAAELAAQSALEATGGGGVLVSLGGDIATAGPVPAGGWNVLVAEDSSRPADGEGQTIAISSGALATSSTTVRRWTRGGITLHHILDPETGLPAAGPWRTATVAAATCVDANAAATAAIVRGHDAIPWLEANRLDARLVAHDGLVACTGRWPAAGEVAATA
jgi:FAD:protein FMN transferase